MTAPTLTEDDVYLLNVIDREEITYDAASHTFLWSDVPVDPDDAVTLALLVADGLATTTRGVRAPLALTTRGETAR